MPQHAKVDQLASAMVRVCAAEAGLAAARDSAADYQARYQEERTTRRALHEHLQV